jgi:hypothetical protein
VAPCCHLGASNSTRLRGAAGDSPHCVCGADRTTGRFENRSTGLCGSRRLSDACLVLCHSQKLECHWLCQCIVSSTLVRTCTGGASGTQPENQAVTKH